MASIYGKTLDDSALNVSWNKFSSKTQTSKELLDSSKNIDSVAGILFSSFKSPESAEPLEDKTQLGESLPDTVHDAQARESALFDVLDINLGPNTLPSGYYVICLDPHTVCFIPPAELPLEPSLLNSDTVHDAQAREDLLFDSMMIDE